MRGFQMNRWLVGLLGLCIAAEASVAQQTPATPGFMVIRVKVSEGTAPGGGPPGMGEGPGMGPGGGGIGFPPGMGPGGGILPPGMGPGGGILPPGGGVPGAGTTGNQDKYVVVTVPFKKYGPRLVYTDKPKSFQNNPVWPPGLYLDDHSVMLFGDYATVFPDVIKQGSFETDIKADQAKWLRTRDQSFETLLAIIESALEKDQMKLALDYADLMVKRVDLIKDPAPKPTGRVGQFLKQYKELKARIDEALVPHPDTDKWKERIGAASTAESKHYTIINWGLQSVSDPSLRRRLDALEKNFTTFYLWNTLNGATLKYPKTKLLVVLANRASDIPALASRLDGKLTIPDGFYSATHNLLVLSPERTDDNAHTFLEMIKGQYQLGWSREELLQGKAPSITETRTYNDIGRTMTFALVDKLLEDEGDLSVISHVANRQLVTVSGMITQHLLAPEWLESGVSNLICKPKNPGIVEISNGKHGVLVGLQGNAAPNYLLLREFRQMLRDQETEVKNKTNAAALLRQKKTEMLLATLTNKYFVAAREGKDLDNPEKPAVTPGGGGIAPPSGGGIVPPPMRQGSLPKLGGPENATAPMPGFPGSGGPGYPMPGGPGPGPGQGGTPAPLDPAAIKAKLENKAHATAWSLTYFLHKTRMESTHKFYEELNKFPRDLRLDDQAVVGAFARAFNLMKADQTGIDPVELERFAANWTDRMRSFPETWEQMEVKDAPPPPPAGGGIPGGGMLPMGGPGGPGR